MPAVEVADAIVQTGRETLERVTYFSRHYRTPAKADDQSLLCLGT